MKKILNKGISFLNLDFEIKNKLTEHNILIINDLWILQKNDLKNIGFNNEKIKKISIQLQLNRIDFKKKVY